MCDAENRLEVANFPKIFSGDFRWHVPYGGSFLTPSPPSLPLTPGLSCGVGMRFGEQPAVDLIYSPRFVFA